MDLALNNGQWLICHKTKAKQSKPINKFQIFREISSRVVLESDFKHHKLLSSIKFILSFFPRLDMM